MAKHKKLQTIILTGFSINLVILLITFTLAWYFLNNAQRASNNISNDDVPAAFFYLRMLESANLMQSSVLEYLGGETEEIEIFKEAALDFDTKLNNVIKIESETVENVQKMVTIKNLIAEYKTSIDNDVFERFNPKNETQAFDIYNALAQGAGERIHTLLEKLSDERDQSSTSDMHAESELASKSLVIQLYLKMIDEAGDMLNALLAYVAGETNQKQDFSSSAELFEDYIERLNRLALSRSESEQLKDVRLLFAEIRTTANDIFSNYNPTKKVLATKRVDELEHDVHDRLIRILTDSAAEEENDAKVALDSLNNTLKSTIIALLSAAIVSIVLGLFIVVTLNRSILSALSNVMDVSEAISDGDFGEAKQNLLNYNPSELENRSSIEEFEEVRANLIKTLGDLIEANRRSQRQDWLKNGISDLNSNLRGELPLDEIAKRSVDFIAKYLNASVAFLYRSEINEQDQLTSLKITAHYGATLHNNTDFPQEYYPGEGLIGQCFIDKSVVVHELNPDDAMPITQSGIAKVRPRFVIVAPLLFEQSVEGVIELATNDKPNEDQVEFIHQLIPNLGIAMRVAVSRDRMTELLTQSQRQTEELAKQQNMLGYTNEQLSEKAQELTEQQEKLQDKNLALEAVKRDLEHQTYELEKSVKYKSEFLANMSHELRSPLNSMLILADLLKTNAEGNLTEKQRSYAEVIFRSGNNLLVLINDILDLSKVEAGKMEIDTERFPITTLLGDISDTFSHMAENKGLKFSINDCSGVEDMTSDFKRLKQILINLIANAIKFTEKGSVTLHIQSLDAGETTQHGKPLSQDTFCYQIKDTGIGIPADKLEDIFNPFCQADGKANRNYEGTGLGLSISSQLAHLLGGHLEVESEEGEGTSLYLYLPKYNEPQPNSSLLKQDDTTENEGTMPLPVCNENPLQGVEALIPPEFLAGIHQDTPLADTAPPDSQTPLDAIESHARLLIIANDAMLHNQLRRIGEDAGFDVVAAFDGGKGLALAVTLMPSAVIIADNSNIVDGKLLVEKFKANLDVRHIPIHLIANQLKDNELITMGVADTLVTPVSSERIKTMLRNINTFLQRDTCVALLISPYETVLQQLGDFLASDSLELIGCRDVASATKCLNKKTIDIVIISLDDNPDICLITDLLRQNALHDNIPTPVIIHCSTPFSSEQKALLSDLEKNHPIVPVFTNDSLLIETSLFLHQVCLSLTPSQQKLLRNHYHADNLFSGKRLLVVDDQLSNIYALTEILETHGMQCTIANNGLEALELIMDNAQFDLILMDIMMPEMDGYETMARIRQLPSHQHTPIIALTAKSLEEDRQICIEAGANDYMTKPLNAERLLYMLKLWLAGPHDTDSQEWPQRQKDNEKD